MDAGGVVSVISNLSPDAPVDLPKGIFPPSLTVCLNHTPYPPLP